MPDGDLVVAGSGMNGVAQMTLETVEHVRRCDKLLMAVPAGVAERWLSEQNPSAESLRSFYGAGKDRLQTYSEMADHVVSFVRAGLRTCLIAYGHPGVYGMPTHLAVLRARAAGFPAVMLPGVSADACLTADLGVDPGQGGCRSYEATDLLARRRPLDPWTQLQVWQVGLIGMLDSDAGFDPRPGLRLLTERLLEAYPADHPVVVYEAATWPGGPARTEPIALADLPEARTSVKSTLYVPAIGIPDYDDDVLAALGIGAEARQRRRAHEHFRRELLAAARQQQPAPASSVPA